MHCLIRNTIFIKWMKSWNKQEMNNENEARPFNLLHSHWPKLHWVYRSGVLVALSSVELYWKKGSWQKGWPSIMGNEYTCKEGNFFKKCFCHPCQLVFALKLFFPLRVDPFLNGQVKGKFCIVSPSDCCQMAWVQVTLKVNITIFSFITSSFFMQTFLLHPQQNKSQAATPETNLTHNIYLTYIT